MKFTVTMKDPDTLQDAIAEAVRVNITIEGLDAEETEMVRERRSQAIAALCAKWFEWGECLCVEIDTDTKTCVVLEAKK